jgi:general secretion pathway protein K
MKRNYFSHVKKMKGNKGAAIFMALLIIAIVVTIAMALIRFQQFSIRQTQMMMTSQQSYLYAQGVEDWAIGALLEESQHPNTIKAWPLILPPTQIANRQGSISGILQDGQGLFNLNNFTALQNNNKTTPNTAKSPLSQPQLFKSGFLTTYKETISMGTTTTITPFLALLKALNIQLSPEQQKNLINAITDWVSPSSNSSSNVFDQHYRNLNPPYRSPHAPMASVSELRTVMGITPSIYNRLLPYIVALPNSTTLNVQNAPPLLQQALSSKTNGQETTQKNLSTLANLSPYYLLRTDVYLEDQHLILYTLIERNTNAETIKNTGQLFNIKWRSFGTE